MSEILWMGIFFGIITGLIICYFIILLKRRSLVKNAIKRIEKQKMKYRIGGKKVNILTGEIEKEPKKDVPSVPSPKVIEKKEPKIKKKIKKRKYLSTLKTYQKKKGKKKQ